MAPTPRVGAPEQPLDADRVGRIGQHAQVGEQILDLAMLIEAQSADHVVRDAPAHQRLFDQARLRVDPVEHHDVGWVGESLGAEASDLARDEVGLVALGHPGEIGDELARGVFGPQALVLALAIVADHGVGGGQDGLGRAIVLLELEDAGLGKVALEVEDVADVGAAPSVDRLVLVADYAEIRAARRKRAHQQVLHAVGVLVFVDQQMLRARLPSLQDVRDRCSKELDGPGAAGR